jgi:hypothetical protein
MISNVITATVSAAVTLCALNAFTPKLSDVKAVSPAPGTNCDSSSPASSDISWDGEQIYFDASLSVADCVDGAVAHSAEVIEGRDNIIAATEIRTAECDDRFQIALPTTAGVYTLIHSYGSEVGGHVSVNMDQRLIRIAEDGSVVELDLSESPTNLAYEGGE